MCFTHSKNINEYVNVMLMYTNVKMYILYIIYIIYYVLHTLHIYIMY